jgi:orotidine-5'-phosphate decarboxylase
MSADIKLLQTPRAEITRSVVEMLEAALADAKRGDIAAAALAIVRPNGAMNTAWSDMDPVAPLLGAVALLEARLCQVLDADQSDGIA